jgi:hypothetical protein
MRPAPSEPRSGESSGREMLCPRASFHLLGNAPRAEGRFWGILPSQRRWPDLDG